MKNLKHIEINIWKACNNKCRFCMSSKPELWDIKFVKLDELKEKIKWYATDWYKSIGFLWWDISIHPDIVEIISYCKELWFININVISNGMKFDDFEFTKKVINAWLTRINISIHSHIDEIEDYLIQVKWWLQRKLKAIDNIKYFYEKWLLRDDLSINIVLNSKNYKTIVESVLFFYLKKKISDIRINFIWLNDDIKENWDDLKLSYTEFLPYLKKLIYISIKYNIRITFDTIPACIFYKIDIINFKTLIKKFLWEDLDHITEIDHINNDEQFNWKERKKDMLKMQFPHCNKCDYNISCQWVRKNYWELYKWNEFVPINLKNQNTNNNEKKDLKYFYEEIDKWNLEEIEGDILELYLWDILNEKYTNLYSLYLSKKKEYKKANEILFNLLDNKNSFDSDREKWIIYFNIAVNYANLNDNNKAGEFLEFAKNIIWNEDNFQNYYNNFHWMVKKYNLDDFSDELKKYYKDDLEILKKYIYIDNFINNLN